jgi:hypothetical protein
MTKKNHLPDNDRAAFEKAMLGVKRHIHTKIEATPTPPKPKRIQQPEALNEVNEEYVFGDHDALSPISGDSLLYSIKRFANYAQANIISKQNSTCMA